MKFILTINVPDHVDIPARAIAQIMREVEPVIETQNPLAEHFHVRDRFGVETCEWQCEPDEPEGEARRRRA
jgi:hypothetical protein